MSFAQINQGKEISFPPFILPRSTVNKRLQSRARALTQLFLNRVISLFITQLFSMLWNAPFTCMSLPDFQWWIIFQ